MSFITSSLESLVVCARENWESGNIFLEYLSVSMEHFAGFMYLRVAISYRIFMICKIFSTQYLLYVALVIICQGRWVLFLKWIISSISSIGNLH